LTASPNLFAYCSNNPIILRDPNGTDDEPVSTPAEQEAQACLIDPSTPQPTAAEEAAQASLPSEHPEASTTSSSAETAQGDTQGDDSQDNDDDDDDDDDDGIPDDVDEDNIDDTGYEDDDGRPGDRGNIFGTIVQGVSGLAYGVVQGFAPGGFLAPSPAPQSRAFEFFRGGGQILAGITEAAGGALGEAGGTVLDATGIGAVVGVPVNVASAAVAANGVVSVGSGAGTMWHAITMSGDNGGGGEPSSGGGGSGASGRPKLVSNPKHHPGSVSPEPSNVQELFDKSIADESGVRWAKGEDGTIHRFSKPSNGETHWNGSTAGVDPIRAEDIPIKIRRGFK
jgi:hypothetical protein